nr:unnamed protein product [Callosobruchus analis]
MTQNLAVTPDISLRYEKHVNYLSREKYCSPNVLNSNRHNFPTKVKINSLYGPYKTKNLQRLRYGIRRQERISHKLKEMHWLNMEARRFLHRQHYSIDSLFINLLLIYLKSWLSVPMFTISININRAADSSDFPYGTIQTVI